MNEGLLALAKMMKGRSLETSDLIGEGSGTKSANTVENQTEWEPFAAGKAIENSFEGNYRKLELPLFNGVDPDSWIFRAKRSSLGAIFVGRLLPQSSGEWKRI
ncbi:Hypothetical predicted protein [Olea europaea subsp. europaea]|uniref:Uncharacterized protein n=1 Tax=Olea europaea subsp. europaea TaxID=158383 RepID=A0A8S0V6P7_OLEEU|nr:Hypothetical predicted protein [Olea europaea subsp. europaea]